IAPISGCKRLSVANPPGGGTDFPSTSPREVRQDLRGVPSTSTVQAPHWPSLQPYFVPVRSSCSRRTQRRGDWESASTFCDLPLTSKLETLAIKPRCAPLEEPLRFVIRLRAPS